jgi:carboxymethylenebutenolidase
MSEIQRYLAEEVAEDHVDGILIRREATRRLGLLGVTGAAASSLLATFPHAVAGAQAAARRGGSGRGAGRPSGRRWSPRRSPSRVRTTLMGAFAPAARARCGVLVIHASRGLTDHIRSVAG